MSQTSEMRRLVLHAVGNMRTVRNKSYSDHFQSKYQSVHHIRDLKLQMVYAEAIMEMVAACMSDDEAAATERGAVRDAKGRFVKEDQGASR